MKLPPPLHPWPTEPQTARRLQEELAGRLCLRDPETPLRLIAGIDCSSNFWSHDLCAVIVIYDLQTREIIDQGHAFGRATFPYIPGFLTFREGPLVVEAFSGLTVQPDALMFDGQGIAHPRGLGLAAHMGLWFRLPSIGCAKSHFFGDYEEPGPEPGDFSPLSHAGRIIGSVLRTRKRARPLFISPGNHLSVDGARRLLMQTSQGYRLPEPTRLAHIEANRLRKSRFHQ